jgi:beta-glucosidase
VLADPKSRAAARRAAQRSMVLLKNDKQQLPLKAALASVAVIGPLADSRADTEGSWMVFGHQPAAVTVLEGLRARLGKEKVSHAPGPEIRRQIPSFFDAFIPGPKPKPQTAEEGEAAFKQAVETARGAELVVAVMGEKADMSGEAASRSSLELPGRQQELLKAVLALGKPVVLVLIGGRPLALEWEAQNVPAILEAWQPGSEGGHAVADVLFGDVNPGGKLPATFPRKSGHAPLYYARTLTHQPEGSPMYQSRYWDGPTTPLYPFGYGLSYTTFAFSNLVIDMPQLKMAAIATVSVNVTNTGPVAGDEVVQLYVHQKAGGASRPMRELKGFRRITLEPGETQTVRFPLGPQELSYWSSADRRWVQETEAFDVWVGSDSQAALRADLAVVR